MPQLASVAMHLDTHPDEASKEGDQNLKDPKAHVIDSVLYRVHEVILLLHHLLHAWKM